LALVWEWLFFIFLWLYFFSKQKISKVAWISLVVVCVGMLLLNDPSHSGPLNWYGVFMAVLSAIFYAVYILISKKQALAINPYLSTLLLCLVCSIHFLGMAQIDHSLHWPASTAEWTWTFALGFFGTSAPVLLMLKGLKHITADIAGILSVLEPVVTVILGAYFLDETLSLMQGIGVMTILGGAVAATVGSSTTSK
jgi:drug/metabolite transporter (DMT)-like permease